MTPMLIKAIAFFLALFWDGHPPGHFQGESKRRTQIENSGIDKDDDMEIAH